MVIETWCPWEQQYLNMFIAYLVSLGAAISSKGYCCLIPQYKNDCQRNKKTEAHPWRGLYVPPGSLSWKLCHDCVNRASPDISAGCCICPTCSCFDIYILFLSAPCHSLLCFCLLHNNKLTYLEQKLQLQQLILCTYAHFRIQNCGYSKRHLWMSGHYPFIVS